MAVWPDSSKKSPNVFLNTIDDIPGSSQSGVILPKTTPPLKPLPPEPPSIITLFPFTVNNAPGFLNEGITILPFTLTNNSLDDSFTNPNVTELPFIVTNNSLDDSFINPDVTELPFEVHNNFPSKLLPFTVNNAPAFINPNITDMLFKVDNAPAFINPNITTIPFVANNAPGLQGQVTLPFIVGSGIVAPKDPLWANVVYLTNTGAVTDISPYNGPIVNQGTTSSTLNSPPNGSWISFNGTTNYYYFTNFVPTTIISEDFTVDGWIRKNSAVDGWIWSQYVSSGGEFFGRTIWYTTSTGIIAFQRGSNFVESAAGVIQPNTTYFVELTRVGGNVRIFVNGNVVATLAITGNLGNIGTAFGQAVGGTGGSFWNGFMSPMRITKGVGRHTANYTAPSPGPFPTSGP